VEPIDAAAMKESLERNERITLAHVGLFADGVAVARVGEEPLRICRSLVDEILTVDTDAICAAIKDAFEDTRSILEPAGALSIAGLKHYVAREGARDRTLIAIASGANMNFDRLRFVSERAELGEEREGIMAVTIPERPGSLKAFCVALGRRNITEFNYRYADERTAQVFVGVSVDSRDELAGVMEALRGQGCDAVDFTDNEMAKLHIRHMVGGHAAGVEDEVLYSVEFPERPGALMKFLDGMPHDWNISLFHYRNHGDNYGRVLIGMQVPEAEREEFRLFLERLGYDHENETGNPAYRAFLA
jgi:threonine dehydratase